MASQFHSVSADSIALVLPNLSAETISIVLAKLVDTGVEKLEDLQHVEQQDLVPLLKPIQARELLSSWSKTEIRI